MSYLRLGAIFLGLGLLAPALLADEDVTLKNWAAAPYWSPVPASLPSSGILARENSFRIDSEAATTSGPTPLPFVAITPCRLIDTRSTSGFPPGYGPPSMPGVHTQRSFTIVGQCAIPADAQAVSFNFTVWAPVTRGDIRVFPAGGGTPNVATLNWEANILALANAAIVPLGTGGAITVQVDGPGTVDLIVDVNGYYSPLGVVNHLNTLSGDVTLAAGTNVSITPVGNILTIAAAAGGGPPLGPAGGSLTGTYPNPGIAAGAVGQPQLANATAVRSINGAAQDLVTIQGSGDVSVSTAGSMITIGAPSGSMVLGAPGDTTLIGAGYTEIAPTPIDYWTATTTTNAPSGRFAHTAVWTGSKMIIWGGNDGSSSFNDGGQYDPVANAWTATTTTNAPSARLYYAAVGAGSKMIVWGGFDTAFTNTGGIYDAIGDTWTATTTTGAPSGRTYHTAVWTGSRMIVWGGGDISGLVNDGGQYDPVANAWTPTTTTNAPSGRTEHTVVWTGSKMIVWGGRYYSGGYVYLLTGGQYDPAANTWTATGTANAPSGRSNHTAVWTGSRMIVWGGRGSGSDYLGDGGVYDPASLTPWTPTTTTNAPQGRNNHTAVWTGSRMIVWGRHCCASGYPNDGGQYDPVQNAWAATTTTGAPSRRSGHTAVWTGSRMLVWGGGYVGLLNDGGQWATLSVYRKN